jgi:hypothetical protein
MTEQAQPVRQFNFGQEDQPSGGGIMPSTETINQQWSRSQPAGLVPSTERFNFGDQKPIRDAKQDEREYIGTQTVGGLTEPMQRARAWAGETIGMVPGLTTGTAAAAKGLSYLDAAPQRFQQMEIPEIRKEIEATTEAAKKVQPLAGYAGTATGFGAGMALPVVKKLPFVGELSPTMSGTLTGGAYGAGEGFLEKFNPSDALKGALEGAVVGRVVTPIANWGANKISDVSDRMGQTMREFAAKNIPFMEGVALSSEARQAAAQAGLTNEEIKALEPHLIDAFKQYGYSPEAARMARFKEFGIEPTKGMITLDPEQLTWEHKHGGMSYEDMARRAQAYAAEKYGVNLPSVADAVDSAAQRAAQEAQFAKTRSDKAYGLAGNFPGGFDRESITNVGDQIRKNLAVDSKNVGIINNSKATEALDALNKTLGVMQPIQGGNVLHRDFNAIESARQNLNTILSSASTKGDKRAVKKVIDAFDDHIESSINNGLFSGDPAVLDQWKQARQLYSDYSQKFGIRRSGEASGKLVQDLVDGTRNPTDVANMMFNFNNLGDAAAKQTGVRTFLELRRALGPNAPELQAVKDSFLKQLMTPSEASPAGFGKTGQQIGNFINGSGRPLAQTILSDAEINFLSRYGMMMRSGSVPPQQQVSNMMEAAKHFGGGMLNAAASYLAYADPAIATLFAVPQLLQTAKRLPAYEARLANKPFTGPEGRFAPQSSAVGPMAQQQLPERDSNAESTGGRIGRATGGSVVSANKADQLIKAAEFAKKAINSRTEVLLDQPDEKIAGALAIAKRHI